MSIINKILGKDESEAGSEKKVAEKAAEVKVENKNEKKESKTVVKPEVKKDADKPKVEKTESAKKSKKVERREDLNAYKILQRPVITEKVTDLMQFNKYTFAVPVAATKNEIKKTIKNVYGVEPVAINVIRVSGKKVRFGRRYGRTKNWKKAIVTLAKGDKIEVYEGV